MEEAWNPVAPPVPQLWTPVRIDPTGIKGPTKGQAAGPHWRSTSPGRSVPAHVTDELVEQRILEAYAACGPNAVVTGWAGLRLHGAGFSDGLGADGNTRLDVPVSMNGGRTRSRPGVITLRTTVPTDEVVVIHGVRCAVIARALLDQIRLEAQLGGDEWDQISQVDMACAAQLISIKRMARYRWMRYWYRDIRTLDRILPKCTEDARSPREVDFRRVWTDHAGWPNPLCNRTITDDEGRVIGMPDLFDVDRSVAGEYAGGGHRQKHRHNSDLIRAAAFRRVGIEIVEVTNTHIERPGRVVGWMQEAEERASLLPRRWQVAPRTGPTLDQILDRQRPLEP